MIRLRTLGGLDLRDSEGRELRAVLAQPKRLALLAYLALASPRGFHRRDALLALLWPEHDAEHARNSLSQSVHILRRHLGPETIVANGDALGLGWKNLWCDTVAFEEALDSGRVAEAVDIYRGDLLEAFHIASAPEFERWLEAERGRLASRFANALEVLAEEREAAADFAGAVIQWRRLAARDSYSSRVALRLMRALTAAGDPAAAVHHARVHEALLKEELGVVPDNQVAELVRQLHSGQDVTKMLPRVSLKATAAPTPTSSPAIGEFRERSERRKRIRLVPVIAASLAALLVAGPPMLKNGTQEASIPPIRSIAVLPLENHSGDSAWQGFADGMHDVLLTELARYPELSVISRTSVMQYRGTNKRLPEIARELKVDAIVEGSVFREGGRVRMNAQLVHGPSDRHLWAQSYKRDLRDILVLQENLAQAIAREVRVAAVPPERRRPTLAGPVDSAPREFYLRELYLRGRRAQLSRSLVGLQTAKEHYRRAIERDSSFALAYAGLAEADQLMAFYDFAPVRVALDSSRIMARRAVALDSTLSEARTALAVSLANDGALDAAGREFKRAVELGPSNANAHYWYSMLLVALGRGEEALREAERGLELDPFAPRGALSMKRRAEYLITGERSGREIPVRERRPILKLEPGEPWAHVGQAIELAEEGRCDAARSDVARARELVPGNSLRMLAHVGAVYWLCGERTRARALLAEMKRSPDAGDHAMLVAVLHTRFGETDSAFVWLGRHQQWTLLQTAALSAAELWDPLRSDPRFPQLLERLGLRSQRARQ